MGFSSGRCGSEMVKDRGCLGTVPERVFFEEHKNTTSRNSTQMWGILTERLFLVLKCIGDVFIAVQ